MNNRLRCLSILASACLASGAHAQILQWNFNGANTVPNIADSNFIASPSLTTFGGVTSSFSGAGGSSDPTQPGFGLQTTNYAAQQTNNKLTGIQIAVNTTNFNLSTFSFDLRTSNSSSRYIQLGYTLNGSTWNDATMFTSAGGDIFNNFNTFDFSSISGASNNPNFGIRVTPVFSPVGFTTTNAPITNYGPNEAYRASNGDDRNYASTGTWRFDMVTLNGTFVPPSFTPENLTWNTSSGAWDTLAGNQVWLNQSAAATSFEQNGGQGDNVTFNNPSANSIVTIHAGGVTPNSTTVINSSMLTFTGGSIGGTGGLNKSGTGRLILASSNSFTSVNNATTISAGVIETRANNPLGGGTVNIGNATWNSTTSAHSSAGVVNLTGPVTFDTTSDLTLTSGLTGNGEFTKLGAGTLGIGGVGSNTASMTINAGTVRLDNIGALGGNASTGVAATLTVNNSAVVINAVGNNSENRARLSGVVTLNNGSLVRNQLTVGLGANPTNGDSRFTADLNGFLLGGVFSVSGSSTLSNLETRTAAASDLPGSDGSSNVLEIRMPILLTSGSTLTMSAVNDQASLVGGVETGNIGNTAVALRGIETATNPNDSLTLQSGATLRMTGAGEKRIGSSTTGKPIVARGTSASETTIQADGRTYLTDLATPGSVNSLFVVAGSGTGGLRVEAPMNAVYGGAGTLATSGLFGANPDALVGDVYTMMSANRYAALSGFAGAPAQGADGSPITLGGTITVVATDAAGAIGNIDNGPASATSIKLGVDNAASSGSLTYTITPNTNFANFGGLVLKRSHAGLVTTRLLAAATLNGSSTYDHLGGTLDLNGLSLSVGAGANLVNGQIAGAGALSAASASKAGAASFTVASGARLNLSGALNVSGGTLQLNGNMTASRAASVSVTGSGAIDLSTNALVINYSGGSPVSAIRSLISQGYAGGTWLGTGITSSSAGAGTAIGFAESTDLFTNFPDSFAGQQIDADSLLMQYTVVGDANLDAGTDTIDFNLLASGFGIASARWSQGDFNYDGLVDTIDFNLLASNFGQTLAAEAARPVGAVVPEPSSLLVVTPLLGLMRRRRH